MSQHPQDLVSVIIPVFNAEPFLAECIESVLAQTWRNCEIIIIDDQSSDNSWTIAQQYRRPGIEVVRSPGKGAASARNHGIECAKGSYIQFLDADDLLAPDKIEHQIESLARSPEGTIASCAWGRFRDDPEGADFVEERVWRDYSEAWRWLQESWEGGGMMQTACWLVPRSLIADAGYWDETLLSNPNDDGEFFCRVLLKSRSIVFCATKGVFYRSSLLESLSRRHDSKAIESAFCTLEKYEKHVSDAGFLNHFHQALRLNYLNFMYQHYPSRGDLMKRAWQHVVHLGGTKSEEIGGEMFRKISRKTGFRNALRLRSMLRRRGTVQKPSELE